MSLFKLTLELSYSDKLSFRLFWLIMILRLMVVSLGTMKWQVVELLVVVKF